MESYCQPGTLYVVATPIGNLADISERALRVLSGVDCILAEDTRRTKQLLSRFQLNTALQSYHLHNESEQTQKFLSRLQKGEALALVSDAGTPLISDPGWPLVRGLRESGCNIVAIPGPCAFVTALSISGIPTNRFTFEGFLPAKSKGRLETLSSLVNEHRTMVFYESVHRIVVMLEDLMSIFGDTREVMVGRELTKQFETVYFGTLQSVYEQISSQQAQMKGEYVVVLRGMTLQPKNGEIDSESERILRVLTKSLPLKQASKLASELTGFKTNQLYQHALSFNK